MYLTGGAMQQNQNYFLNVEDNRKRCQQGRTKNCVEDFWGGLDIQVDICSTPIKN